LSRGEKTVDLLAVVEELLKNSVKRGEDLEIALYNARQLYEHARDVLELELRLWIWRQCILLADKHFNAAKLLVKRQEKLGLLELEDIGKEYMGILEETFKSMVKLVASLLVKHPVYYGWLAHVKGVGPILSTLLLGSLPWRFKHASAYAKWAGLAPRPVYGGKREYNERFKSVILYVTPLIAKYNKVYQDYFQQKLKTYREKGLKGIQAYRYALKPTARLFLSHFYQVYMHTMERLGAKLKWRKPYPLDILSHTEIPPPATNISNA